MKKAIALIVIVMFSLSVIPSFAAEKSKAGNPNLIQSVGDSIKDFKVREQDKVKTAKNVPIFQNMSNYIKEGSKKAKGLSKRK